MQLSLKRLMQFNIYGAVLLTFWKPIHSGSTSDKPASIMHHLQYSSSHWKRKFSRKFRFWLNDKVCIQHGKNSIHLFISFDWKLYKIRKLYFVKNIPVGIWTFHGINTVDCQILLMAFMANNESWHLQQSSENHPTSTGWRQGRIFSLGYWGGANVNSF